MLGWGWRSERKPFEHARAILRMRFAVFRRPDRGELRMDRGISPEACWMQGERRFYQTTVIPLSNCSMPAQFVAHETDDERLSIVGVEPDRLAAWLADPEAQCSVGKLCWVLKNATAAIRVESYGLDPLSEPPMSEDLGSLSALLDLCLPNSLLTPFFEQRLLGWPEGSFKIARLGQQRPPTEWEVHATIALDEPGFRKYWALIMDDSEQGKRLRRALGRFRHARSSYFFEDAVLNAFIGVEALFGDHTRDVGKVAQRVQARATRFVIQPDASETSQELASLSDDIAKLYQIRHDIVHGADVAVSEHNKVVTKCFNLLSTALWVTLSEGFGRLYDLPALAKAYDDSLRRALQGEKRAKRGAPPRRGGCAKQER
jgi:hypothetical protein